MADGARTRRDLMTDLAWIVVSGGGGMIVLITNVGTQGAGWVPGNGAAVFAVDVAIGAGATAMLWFRRRWPVGVAVAMVVPLVLSRSAQLATYLSVLNVALRRRAVLAVAMAALHEIAFIGFSLLWITYPLWAAVLWVLGYYIAVVSIGLYVRARRELLASLHERIRQAEATQLLKSEQARRAERARIAAEMHDVLAHRVSLMALQAGGLEVRPDLPPAEVRETAGLIRSTGRQALTELRDIIGVLRDGEPGDVPHAPQPRLRDIARLVGEYRQAGLHVELKMSVEAPDAAPGPLGRDAYRIVREALTNVSKHARGTAASVSLSGGPGEGLRVTVRNKLPLSSERTLVTPLPAPSALPGAGLGLVSLAERIALAGGSLEHGPDGDGDFVLTAALRWED